VSIFAKEYAIEYVFIFSKQYNVLYIKYGIKANRLIAELGKRGTQLFRNSIQMIALRQNAHSHTLRERVT